MHVFYQPVLSSDDILLNEEESKHCVKVLRMKNGDEVHLADGKGTHAVAVLVDHHPKNCRLQIRHKEKIEQNRNYRLHIAIAPAKNAERNEWFIEKAVECGIDEISFVETHHSERAKINMERYLKVAISAMKQSKQWWLPIINPIRDFAVAIDSEQSSTKLIAWCEADDKSRLNKQLKPGGNQSVTIFIGPEGDFTHKEIELAQSKGIVAVSLGKSILRTETAALYACMAAKAILD